MPNRFLTALALSAMFAGATPDGAALYKKRCAGCHDGAPQPRMPSRQDIGKRSPEEIVKTMLVGAMRPQSAGLTPEDVRAIARFLTGKELGKAETSTSPICPASAKPFRMEGAGWNGWGGDVANTRYQANAGLAADQVPKLKLKWAFGFPGTSVAFSQPTMVGGRVFVGSGSGKVYSLDAATGCTYWSYDADIGVRTAISIGSLPGGKYAAYFGDLSAVAYALDASTGRLLWRLHVDDHPVARITGSPVLFAGRLYVPVASLEEASAMSETYECCKFRGSIVALDAATGKQIWKSYSVMNPAKPTKKSKAGTQFYGPAGAAIWSAPTIDAKRKLIYAATGNSYTDVNIGTSNAILALDMDSGRLKWASQVLAKDNFVVGCRFGREGCPAELGPDHDFGSSPILRTLSNGKQIVLAGQKSSTLYGMDPERQGKVLWQIKLGQGGLLGGIEWGFAADSVASYVAVSDRTTTSGTPGGLHAIRMQDGRKLWTKMPAKLDCEPRSRGCNSAQSAAVSVIPGAVFSGSIDGHLRAFSTKTGEITWDFNTAQRFQTVNGVPATGGSIDGAGPTIANGLVLTNSGYGLWNGLPGNVLLAFSVDGK
jgi:polyvinyl alcohol dehydrogenase (cytochrome)